MADTDTSTTERRFTMPRCDSVAQVRNTRGTAATTSPLLAPGDVISKRTSTHLGDPHTPSLSPKRTKREARSPIGTLESLDSAAQRGAPTAGALTRPHSATTAQHTEGARAAPGPRTSPPTKSASFWYPDGSVVIKADATYYKLHTSRLARYCVHFKKLFADDTDDHEDRYAKVEGCPVYHILTDLDSDDFEKLLAALETPLIYTDAPPTQSVALSLVRAAHSLSCDVILKLARRRLCAIWDAQRPSTASARPASLGAPSKTSPSFSSSGVDTDTATVHTYHDAVFINFFARQY